MLASTSLKPSKLKRHLERNHPSSANKDLDFFKRIAEKLHKSWLHDKGMFFQTSMAGLRASYEASRKIAVAKNPHNIGKQSILPFCEDISITLGSFELKKLRHVSLSNDTVGRRIGTMSDNILSQVLSKIQHSILNFF